jgi:hypothetical protein
MISSQSRHSAGGEDVMEVAAADDQELVVIPARWTRRVASSMKNST